MMESYRSNPPKTLAGMEVSQLLDYQQQVATNLKTGSKSPIQLPKSNVLQFLLEDGSKASARPSGTEPKIKFYFSVNAPLASADQYEQVEKELDEKIQKIIKDLNL
jgi:phosphoglucomutase